MVTYADVRTQIVGIVVGRNMKMAVHTGEFCVPRATDPATSSYLGTGKSNAGLGHVEIVVLGGPLGASRRPPHGLVRHLGPPRGGRKRRETATAGIAYGCGSKPFWYYFGVGAPPILVYFSGD